MGKKKTLYRSQSRNQKTIERLRRMLSEDERINLARPSLGRGQGASIPVADRRVSRKRGVDAPRNREAYCQREELLLGREERDKRGDGQTGGVLDLVNSGNQSWHGLKGLETTEQERGKRRQFD